jgi:hypothetical protein
MKKYTIYKLIDPTDNRIRYVGMTKNKLSIRLSSHCHDKRGKSHKINWIQSLVRKGLKPTISIIEENILTLEEADMKEVFWISKLLKEGHNLTNTEMGGYSKKGISDSTKLKISENSKKRFEKEEERQKLRISNKRYEDSKTEEQKINDILVQNSKRVTQYDLDMNKISEFLSIGDAQRKTNIERGNISKCCNLKVISAGGYIWRYEGDTQVRYRKKRKTKSVLQFDLDGNFIKKFNSVKEAANELEINGAGINSCCINKFKSSNGYIWKYENNI